MGYPANSECKRSKPSSGWGEGGDPAKKQKSDSDYDSDPGSSLGKRRLDYGLFYPNNPKRQKTQGPEPKRGLGFNNKRCHN